MAQKVEIDVVAKTDKATKAINNLNSALDKVSTAGDKQRKGFKALDKVTGGYATKVKDLAGAVKDGIGGFKGLIKTVKGFRTALLTTGIGALVVALGLVVAYWDDIKDAVNGVSKAQKESLDLQKEAVLESEKQAEITRSMENTLKLQGKTEKQIRDLKKQQLGETIKNLEAQLLTQREMKKSQVEAAERNKSIAKGIIAFLSAPILILTGLVDGITNSLAAVGVLEEGTSLTEDYLETTSSFLFDPEKVAAEGDAVIDETEKKLRELKNKRDGFILQDNKEEQARIKKENEEKLKLEEEYQKRLADLKNRIREAEANTEEEARALELKKIEEHNKKLMAEALANGLLSQELINSLNETLQAKKDEFALKDREKAQAKKIEELELDREFDTLTFDEQRAILQAREDILNEDKLLSTKQQEDLEQQFADARVSIADAEFKAKMTAAMGYASALSDVSGVIGEETAAGKAMAVAASLINTYASIAGQIRAFSEVGIPGYAIAQAIATGAVGFANVKKIISTKIPKSSGGGGGGASAGAAAATPQAPSFNIVGATETSQLAEAVGSQTQEPVQAYVVANDITTAQSLENNIVEGATL
jgi:hypothetical protein